MGSISMSFKGKEDVDFGNTVDNESVLNLLTFIHPKRRFRSVFVVHMTLHFLLNSRHLDEDYQLHYITG